MRESYNLEFKESVNNTFLKTVSAYANYGRGKILFGIKDNGEIIGIDKPDQVCLNIENKINDSIKPRPEYFLEIDSIRRVISLTVLEGKYKPYLYKSKAYQRRDSSTIEVEGIELNSLILQGQNRNFDEIPSSSEELTFNYLENKLQDKLGIERLTDDILITLELANKNKGYTKAGDIFADENSFMGLDIVRFGPNINTILHRYINNNISILKQYDESIRIYQEFYQYEVIDGAYRRQVEAVPEEAFREAIANALVHRRWDVAGRIQVSMFEDRIEITSPGGLPQGVSEDEYLYGQISILRNPIIANIFHRLDIIESFETGIKRIYEAYEDSRVKPTFKIFENSIQITLPIKSLLSDLAEEEVSIYKALEGGDLASSEIVKKSGFGKNKVLGILESLIEEGYVEKIGRGRGTKYRTR